MIKNTGLTTFASLALEKRKIKKKFFHQINVLISWNSIETTLNQTLDKKRSPAGRPRYSPLLLFKILLLQTWYKLSDYEVEEQLNENLSFMQFVGLSLEQDVPDHSVISRFRTKLIQKGLHEKLLTEINAQLTKHGILVKTGAIVDASITQSPFKPKGSKAYEIAEDRKEGDLQKPSIEKGLKEKPSKVSLVQKVKPGVDIEAAWLKKGGRIHYGYKRHTSVEDRHGLVVSVVTTSANESDMHHLLDVLEKGAYPQHEDKRKRVRVLADKGYSSKENRNLLEGNGYKSGVLFKASKSNALTYWERVFNKQIGRVRYKIERTFGGMVRWFGAGKARYVGLAKTHGQHIMESIAYNLYRSPNILRDMVA